jgi:hypothetical protein
MDALLRYLNQLESGKETALIDSFQIGGTALHIGILNRAVQIDRITINFFEKIQMQ